MIKDETHSELVLTIIRARTISTGLWFLLVGSVIGNILQYGEYEDLEDHVEYLEQYIEENSLPVPAIRINIGDDNGTT